MMTNEEHWENAKGQVMYNHGYIPMQWKYLERKHIGYYEEAVEVMAQSIREEYEKKIKNLEWKCSIWEPQINELTEEVKHYRDLSEKEKTDAFKWYKKYNEMSAIAFGNLNKTGEQQKTIDALLDNETKLINQKDQIEFEKDKEIERLKGAMTKIKDGMQQFIDQAHKMRSPDGLFGKDAEIRNNGIEEGARLALTMINLICEKELSKTKQNDIR